MSTQSSSSVNQSFICNVVSCNNDKSKIKSVISRVVVDTVCCSSSSSSSSRCSSSYVIMTNLKRCMQHKRLQELCTKIVN